MLVFISHYLDTTIYTSSYLDFSESKDAAARETALACGMPFQLLEMKGDNTITLDVLMSTFPLQKNVPNSPWCQVYLNFSATLPEIVEGKVACDVSGYIIGVHHLKI